MRGVTWGMSPSSREEGAQGKLPRSIGAMWYARREFLGAYARARTSKKAQVKRASRQGDIFSLSHVSVGGTVLFLLPFSRGQQRLRTLLKEHRHTERAGDRACQGHHRQPTLVHPHELD